MLLQNVHFCFLCTDIQKLRDKSHTIKNCVVIAELQILADKGQMVLEDKGDKVDEKGPIKIEVRNVPEATPLESLKTFFESKDSDSDVGAVADISSIETGVFHVTFHDQSGKEIGYIDHLKNFLFSNSG